MSGLIKIIPGILNLFPALGHGAGVWIHIILVGSITEPSGHHFTICIQIIVDIIDLLPSGHHLGVRAEIIPAVIDLLPPDHHLAGSVCIEPAPSISFSTSKSSHLHHPSCKFNPSNSSPNRTFNGCESSCSCRSL